MIDILQQKWPEILDFFKQEYDIQDISFKTFILPLKVKSFENNVVTLVFTGRSGSASLQYINKKYLNIKVVNLKNQLNFVILITFMLNTIIINRTIFIYNFTYSFKLIPIIR